MTYCKICNKPNCKKHTILLSKVKNIKEFSGSSPPEIFVGKYNYPNVNVGILSPTSHGDTSMMSSVEEWHKQKLQIPEITSLRGKLIYGRTQNHIKKLNQKFLSTMQEVALAHKSISTEFKLKKPISTHKEKESRVPLISNAAQIEKVKLQENSTIKEKVEKITTDDDAKSQIGIQELETHTTTSQIIKILSAGLLGRKTARKLVPTRWSITAVDSTLSKNKIKKIRYFPEISEFLVFTGEYLGNHYEFLLLPDRWSFEVIERTSGEVTCEENLDSHTSWKDYESFFNRTKYAESVTGAYYANRLALTEYLTKIKRQASCLVFREIRPEYDTPMGVGILRQASRAAFTSKPQKYNTLQDALHSIQNRLKQPIINYTQESILLKEYNKQSRLSRFF